MRFSLVYTSRRAQSIGAVIGSWLVRAAHPEEVEVILGIDSDYAEGLSVAERLIGTAQTYEGQQVALSRVKLTVNPGPFNCVAGWNVAAAEATGDILIAVADDFMPPDNWDEALLAAGPAGWWSEDRVVAVADGYNPDLFTLAIITRRRYRRFGYLFYPGYASLFSHNQHTNVAKLDTGCIINATHLLFEHLHPDCGKRSRDDIDLKHASSQRWKQGELLFNFRRDTGFPLDAGPRAETLEVTYDDLRFAVYVQAIRDDFCLADVVERVVKEGAGRVKAVFIFAPDEYWGGKPQRPEDATELEVAHARLSAALPGDVDLHWLSQTVAPQRLPGLSRIQVETRVRNEAVESIREKGFEHILIVDGDELWNPGFFDRLVNFIREFRPSSVFTGMTPVIGLPGYPVDGATDKATVYIGPGSWFVECRGVSGHRHELPSVDVIHFTATRRTAEEIISKHRESGHADDPNYAMEEWIEKVFPNIRPGFSHQFSPTSVGLHMYRPYQVWPAVRNWRKEEWELLPASVKPYLAQPAHLTTLVAANP